MSVYRLYIDESGHHRVQLAGSIAERYLGLCGIVVRDEEYANNVIPRIEVIRSMIYTDPDFKPPLHLEDVIGRKNAFHKIRDAEIEQKLNSQLMSLYTAVDYRIICEFVKLHIYML